MRDGAHGMTWRLIRRSIFLGGDVALVVYRPSIVSLLLLAVGLPAFVDTARRALSVARSVDDAIRIVYPDWPRR